MSEIRAGRSQLTSVDSVVLLVVKNIVCDNSKWVLIHQDASTISCWHTLECAPLTLFKNPDYYQIACFTDRSEVFKLELAVIREKFVYRGAQSDRYVCRPPSYARLARQGHLSFLG